MMLTEKEAREKWCPHVRLRGKYDDAATSSFNRYTGFDNDLTPECHCIASDCMAWRIDASGKLVKGFCGLAGRHDQ